MSNSSVYSSLTGSEEIRLFNLLPGPQDAEICCDLIHVFLQDNPDYEALSYTWKLDDPIEDQSLCSITVSGETLETSHVTPNLYRALKRLRHPTEPRALWVDAICINQEETSERSHQVQIMNKIYSKARLVIVWIGEEGPNDWMAFDFIRKWQEMSRASENSAFDEVGEFWRMAEVVLGSPLWPAIASILSRRWFRRVWVIQEVVMAADALLVSGSLSIPWIMLEGFLDSLKRLGLAPFLQVAGGNNSSSARIMAQRISEIKELRKIDFEQSLLLLLSATRELEATDPRDKVYSLYALVPGVDVPIPDYSVSADELFKKVSSTILQGGSGLTLLAFYNYAYQQEGPNVATWAPNWIAGNLDWNPLLGTSGNYAATGDRNFEYKISEDGLSLTLRGIQFDRVSATGSEFDSFAATTKTDLLERNRESCRQTLIFLRSCEAIAEGTQRRSGGFKSWLKKGLTIKRFSHTSQRFEEALCRTVVCNATPLGEPVPKDIVKGYRAYKKTMVMLSQDPPESISEDLLREGVPFQSAISTWIGGRVFGRTSNGYMGMLPSKAAKDDIVCAFMGGVTPFVIRPKKDGFFQLIGACYIHGMMNGEILKLPNFESRLEEITLR